MFRALLMLLPAAG